MTNRLYYLTVFAIVFIVGQVYGQNTKNLADSLFANDEVFDAITEYKRLLFFDGSGDYTHYANFRIAECYKAGGKFDDAVEFFGKALISAETDSLVFATKLELIKVNLLRRTPERAEQIITEIDSDYRFADSTDQINYWKGWIMVFSDNWKRATYFFWQVEIFGRFKKYL